MQRFNFPVLALCLALAACQQAAGPQPLSDTDLATIEAATEAYRVATIAGDAQGLAALYAEDAMLAPPGAPLVEGRAAIASYYQAGPPIAEISFGVVSIEGQGDLAYVVGTYEVTVATGGNEPVQDTGKYIEIRRRGADSSWLIHRDIWNSDNE